MDDIAIPKIEGRNVTKVYGSSRPGESVVALSGVSFAIRPHEFIAIVGPSGCGKSTLLSLIAGFLSPTEGEILLDGKPVREPGRERGFMFQDYALFPWRTVRGNVEFGPLARGVPKPERQEIGDRYIELVGLEGFESRYPHELSGGMRQRCALARLLANEPDVWLMDEPLAAVDLQTRSILQEELLRIWGEDRDVGQRRTVLFVTHGIDEAVFLSDRIIVLGRRPGTIKEIVPIDLPRPRARFRGDSRVREHVEYIWDLIRDEAAQAIVEETG